MEFENVFKFPGGDLGGGENLKTLHRDTMPTIFDKWHAMPSRTGIVMRHILVPPSYI